MSSIWGNNIKISLFGESHGKAIGVVMDGLPSGISLNFDEINEEMKRRAPKKDGLSTTRDEKDKFEIISGYFNEHTTGTPLTALIYNTDKRSKDYSKTKDLMRPGHADYTGIARYNWFNDYRGGGHFSGRLTAPLVFAGSVARQYLKNNKGITIGSRVKSIGKVQDDSIDYTSIKESFIKSIRGKEIPTINDEKGNEMKETIMQARCEGDSVGGVIQCFGINIPVGLGSPFFESVESRIAHMIFSIPGVKGLEFGEGFNITSKRGFETNDEMYYKNKQIYTYTNNNGGIIGGITNGMPIIFNVALKPTPSISKEQKTINISTNDNAIIQIEGRHDPCIILRALPVIESCTALVLMDLIVELEGI